MSRTTSYLEQLKIIPATTVQAYLASKDNTACGISENMAAYISQINDAALLLKDHPNIGNCAAELIKMHPELSLSTARLRVSDSIAYFNADFSVTAEAWNLYFADRIMDLFQEAMKQGDIKEARLCLERARDYRLAAASTTVNPDLIKHKEQLISPDVELERMGIKRSGLLGSYQKIMKIIDNIDASASDKERLKGEASLELGVKDITADED